MAKRYAVIPGIDNKYSVPRKEIQDIAYRANTVITPISPDSEEITVEFGTVTGAMSVTANTNIPQTGDKLRCLLATNGTQRVVTFSTGFSPSGTATIGANKKAVVDFVFYGSTWLEVARFILT